MLGSDRSLLLCRLTFLPRLIHAPIFWRNVDVVVFPVILCCVARYNDYATEVHDGCVIVINIGVIEGNYLVTAAGIFNRELEIFANLVVSA